MAAHDTRQKSVKVTLIESETQPDAKELGVSQDRLRNVELWVRKPDSERLEDVKMAASLCSCRRVCVAVIEDL